MDLNPEVAYRKRWILSDQVDQKKPLRAKNKVNSMDLDSQKSAANNDNDDGYINCETEPVAEVCVFCDEEEKN